MEQLGHEDWRFALVQRMCGIQYNKEEVRGRDAEDANVRSALVDSRESTEIKFVISLL